MTLQGSDLLGVPPTHLPVDPAADALRDQDPSQVAAAYPASSLAWAVLAERAAESGLGRVVGRLEPFGLAHLEERSLAAADVHRLFPEHDRHVLGEAVHQGLGVERRPGMVEVDRACDYVSNNKS